MYSQIMEVKLPTCLFDVVIKGCFLRKGYSVSQVSGIYAKLFIYIII